MNTTQELTKILFREQEKFEQDSQVKEYKKALQEFEELVQQGLLKKRGYTLLTITDNCSYKFPFNMEKPIL